MRTVLLTGALALAFTACSVQPPAEGAVLDEAGCHDSSVDGLFDLDYSGPIDAPDNAALVVGSSDGSCSGDTSNPVTVVAAETRADARDVCVAAGSTTAVPLYWAGYDIAAGQFLCLDITHPAD